MKEYLKNNINKKNKNIRDEQIKKNNKNEEIKNKMDSFSELKSFNELKINQDLLKKIESRFKKPTLIQSKALPLILEGKDVIGESATGSGKTLAFGIGIIEKIKNISKIQALVLVPTRELAEQVKDEIKKLTDSLIITAIYGGVSIDNQFKNLKKSDVVIATPGRLLDHIHRKTIDLSHVKILVLDEADRMVEMGFIDDVNEIIKQTPEKRQTLMFSATMYRETQKIIKNYMKDPVKIIANKFVDPNKLKQTYYNIPNYLKNEMLLHVIKENKEYNLFMIFCNTRKTTDLVNEFLRNNNIKTKSIHGGLTQNKRLKTINDFHKGLFNVLVCTDVAARGLDIKNVDVIVNYDIPKNHLDYIHRIGRTARAGKTGNVINLLSKFDFDAFTSILDKHDFDIKEKDRPYLKKQNFNNFSRRSNLNNKKNNKFSKSYNSNKKHNRTFKNKNNQRNHLIKNNKYLNDNEVKDKFINQRSKRFKNNEAFDDKYKTFRKRFN